MVIFLKGYEGAVVLDPDLYAYAAALCSS